MITLGEGFETEGGDSGHGTALSFYLVIFCPIVPGTGCLAGPFIASIMGTGRSISREPIDRHK
jgi:hypothetical protein